jgi:hypothetical protein
MEASIPGTEKNLKRNKKKNEFNFNLNFTQISWSKSSLFNILEIIFGVSVKD